LTNSTIGTGNVGSCNQTLPNPPSPITQGFPLFCFFFSFFLIEEMEMMVAKELIAYFL